MADRVVIRGDSYDDSGRYFLRIEFVNNLSEPYDLAGCTVRTTYKQTRLTPADDPTDESAFIKHYVTIGADGTVTANSGLRLESTAAAGVLIHDVTKDDTLAFPLATPLYGDVELTNASGKRFTFLLLDAVSAQDGYTHRTVD